MKKGIVFLTVFSVTVFTHSFGQKSESPWAKWKPLIGEWKGEGEGKPGQGKGSFSFETDLGGKILIRKNHSEYPGEAGRPAIIHDDLMIVYAESSGDPSKSIYFDNEGHVIQYAILYEESGIIMTSAATEGTPRYRLTYRFLDDKTLSVKFEIASPQNLNDFKTYLDGRCVRKR